MKIAVEGCCHGELDKIYETLQHLEKKEGTKVDLLLCCGDFQAVRDKTDLNCMAVPQKYRQMQTFYKYYSGEKKAPVLTVFIGGNHEASNHLWELPYGGWVAPGIYYLGYAGVVRFGGLRIAGLSGIFKSHDYLRGHYETPPYDNSTMRSAYHIRSMDIFNLKLLSQPIDIFLSHDWPRGVYHHGNLDELYRYKSFLKDEIDSNTLGSPPAGELLELIQPTYWFAAHLHTKFPALVPHEGKEEVKFTKFLALDKCLPRRNFLQVIDVGSAKGPLELSYDAEWLAIVKLTHELTNVTRNYTVLPTTEKDISKYRPDEKAAEQVVQLVGGNLAIPCNFVLTVPPYDPSKPKQMGAPATPNSNPQTETFCELLGIKNLFMPESGIAEVASSNPDEICLGDDDDDVDETDVAMTGHSHEIHLDDDDNTGDGSEGSKQRTTEASLSGKLSLHLPPPKNLSDVERAASGTSEATTELDNGSKSIEHFSHDGEQPAGPQDIEGRGTSGEDRVENAEPQRKVLKLKRRNQALYESAQDEEQ